METLLQQIIDLVTKTPGNLIYHLVLAFAIISCLQAAWIGRQTGTYRFTGRLMFGLGMLLLGQVILFLSSGVAWQGMLDVHLFLPPLDRAVVLFSIVWMIWLWNFPAPARLGDLVTGLLNLLVVILFLFTFNSWKVQGAGLNFNNTWFDWAWELATLFIVIIGMALLLFSRPTGWGFGLGMLSLILVGLVGHLLYTPESGDFSGYARLGQIAAFPMLSMLLRRFSVPTYASATAPYARAPLPTASAANAATTGQHERRRYSTNPRTLHAFLELNSTDEPEKIISGMAKVIAHTMLSDICFIVNGPNYGHIVLQSGYDLIREEEFKGTMLEQGQLPMLSNALQRSKTLRITTNDSQPPDLKTLSSALGLKDTGSLMFIPLTINDKPEGGLLFLSPYSSREWTQDDQNFLSSEIETIASMLKKAQQGESRSGGAEQIGENLRAEIDNLRQENQKLLSEVTNLSQNQAPLPQANQATTTTAIAPDMDLSALVALQQEAQEQIASLQAENERLQSALRDQGISVLSPEEFERLEFELRTTLQEIAQLQNQLAEANARNLMLERDLHQAGDQGCSEDREVITSIVQDIRQPMASILGYTDLLMSESVGILGALQRKFLERIKASNERMRSMLDDLIQVAALGEGPVEILSRPVELGQIIDGAVADTSAQLREKNIALQVDLPHEMPQINADQDAIQQIVLHLLQNAGAATPQEGIITLRARIQKDNNRDYLMLQVMDTGGGVQPDDLPRVFNRRFRADLPLIQGLGDTGVGLSIAKTLVEAHGGRIWVESQGGESTTFSVLLPVYPINKNGIE